MMNTISVKFYYAGCLSRSGERTSLAALRQEARSGFPVTVVELNPGMISPPWRLYIAGMDYEADEIIGEHCRRYPQGRLARWLGLDEIDAEALEYTPWTITVNGKRVGPAEDYICGAYVINDPKAIQRVPGGRYEAELARKMPGFSIDLIVEEPDRCYVSAYAPGYARPDGKSVTIHYKTCALGRNANRPLAVLQAWQLAAEGVVEPVTCS